MLANDTTPSEQISIDIIRMQNVVGSTRDLNPGPPAPEAGIIPLDH